MIGNAISHYRILEKLGEGGMGVVYKAEDTKLKRHVAIKFLPQQIAAGDEERERFKIEAQAAAALNHPNIAHIYAIEETGPREDGDAMFIVMEYIEGQELREIVGANGRSLLRMEKIIDYATQIASGLHAAHKKGIVHRDIKSSNIMVTETRQIKIMDFGLAKISGRTMLTKTGTTLGTTSYMSPEQAQGAKVDHRSDIFSLGVVVYEMVTGRHPFPGDYEQAVVYSILHEEPEPMTALRAGVPMELERIVNKCMAKHPDERYHHVDEISVDLKAVKAVPRSTSKRLLATKSQSPKMRQIWMRGLGATVIALFVGAAVWEWLRPEPTGIAPVARFRVPLSQGERVANTGATTLALSPDGSALVYVAMDDKGQRLYLRPVDALEAKPIPGTDGASNPFFSPDGRWIGFFADDVLKKVVTAGGPPVLITDAPGVPLGGTWSRDDVIVYTLTSSAGLFQVSAQGGKPKVLTTPDVDNQERSHRYPHFLPDGKSLLFMQISKRGGVWALSLQTGERKFITGGTSPHYLLTGYLVYSGYDGSLHAARFDPSRLELTGPAVPLFAGIATSQNVGTHFSLSANGCLAYVTATKQHRQLILVDRDGKEQLISDDARLYRQPRFSSNGDRLALQIGEPGRVAGNFWIYEFDQGTLSRLTSDLLPATGEWMPGGQRIALSANAGTGTFDIYSVATDFGGQMDTVITSEFDLGLGSWSQDGQWLVYYENHPTTGSDIWALHMGGRKTPAPILQTKYNESAPRLSRNGHWLAYTSDESGHDEVYVRAFPGPGSRWQISVAGGTEPVWSPAGKELFYRQEGKMTAAILDIDSVVRVAKRAVLFEKNDLAFDTIATGTPNYDIHPSGDQFAMVKEVQESESELIVVLSWSEELKRRVPAGQ